jgi:hypothetical protein
MRRGSRIDLPVRVVYPGIHMPLLRLGKIMPTYGQPRPDSARGRVPVSPGHVIQSGHHNTQKYQNFEAHHGGSIGNVSIRNKRTSFRIGRFDLGLGQIGVIAAVLLGGGGAGVAAVASQEEKKPGEIVQRAAGRWTFVGRRPLGDATVTGVVLSVTPEAIYDVSMKVTYSGSPTTVGCTGEVTARGQTLLFTPFETATCKTFTGAVTDDAMTLGSAGDTIELQRK